MILQFLTFNWINYEMRACSFIHCLVSIVIPICHTIDNYDSFYVRFENGIVVCKFGVMVVDSFKEVRDIYAGVGFTADIEVVVFEFWILLFEPLKYKLQVVVSRFIIIKLTIIPRSASRISRSCRLLNIKNRSLAIPCKFIPLNIPIVPHQVRPNL